MSTASSHRSSLDSADFDAQLAAAVPPGRHAATGRARRFHVGIVRPDGTTSEYERSGGSSCEHALEAQGEAGLGGVVRVRPIDEPEAA